MSILKMEMDTDNGAFENGPAYEAWRILERVSLEGLERVFNGKFGDISLMDSNGNYVGRLYLESGESE